MKTKFNRILLATAALSLLWAGSVHLRAATTTLFVTNTADSGPGSLRAALAGAGDGDTIDATGVSGTIILTNGQLAVSRGVTVLGPGAAVLTVSGNHASRVFNVTGANVTIRSLTIADGQSAQSGAGINASGNSGSVIAVTDCIFTNNGTLLDGGGICDNPGVTMTISNCTVSGNSATGAGGGIVNNNSTVTLVASTMTGNSANLGGAIFNEGASPSGTLTILASTLNNNSANYGAAIYTGSGGSGNATVTIASSTLSDNSGHESINNDCYWGGTATLKINASTFSHEKIFNDGGTLETGDTIFNACVPPSAANLINRGGAITSCGYNLSSDDGGGFLTNATDQINTDPKLGSLQNNGGPTPTHALLAGSPALDKGKRDAVQALAVNLDQRGFARPVDDPFLGNAAGGDGSDIGAFESQSGTDTDADGLPDSWELTYFGGLSTCATDDPDGDGQNNLFEYVAGLNPTNPASVFQVRVENVTGQPDQKKLTFKPWVSGRTYTPEFTTNLTAAFAPLTGDTTSVTNDTEVVVTDLNAGGAARYYRIRLSLP
ncbi:MAG: hypothetical protein KGJ60_01255 [Verrucomicrobiota bacterium]|nr:hypothetical protein [Verrucomicrobiota bacterium]